MGGEWDLKTEGELSCSKHWPPRVGEQCASRWKDSRTTLHHGWRMSPEPPPLSFITRNDKQIGDRVLGLRTVTCILKRVGLHQKSPHSDASSVHRATQLTRACWSSLCRCRRSFWLYYFVFRLPGGKKAYRLLFLLWHPESCFCDGRNKKKKEKVQG